MKAPKKTILTLFMLVSCYGLAIGLALALPFHLPPLDALVFYTTSVTFIAGIPIYDYPAQVQWLAAQADVPIHQITVHPYPYPPWYALSLLPLGFFSQAVAARAWFFINCGILFLSTWLLTGGWQTWQRAIAELAAFMFVPALGVLIVGQYDLPVMLGIALFWHAMRDAELPVQGALGLALLTFKPHLGLSLLLGGLVWLLIKKRWRTLLWTATFGLFLVAVGFIADPKWPISYFQAILSFQNVEGVQTCVICTSVPSFLLRQFAGVFDARYTIWIVLATALVLLLIFWCFRKRFASLRFGIIAILLATLLLVPYANNYDFVLLLVPLVLIWPQRKFWLIVAYLLPVLVVALGRTYNFFLLLSAIITLTVLLCTTIDLKPPPAYNTSNKAN